MTKANIPFEQSSSSSKSIDPSYKTPFVDNEEGEGILITPRLVLIMSIERAEVCWTDVKFEANSQTNSTFARRSSELMANSEYSKKITATGLERL